MPGLTVTANNASKGYGSANPVFTAGYSGFVNGDTPSNLGGTLTFTTTATTSSPVGSYPITPGGLTSPNYTITFVAGTLTIGQAVYVLKASDSSTLSLSGNASLNVSGLLQVNSNSPTALVASGNAHVSAGSIRVVGGVQLSGNASLSPVP